LQKGQRGNRAGKSIEKYGKKDSRNNSTCFFAQVEKTLSVLNFRTLNLKNEPATQTGIGQNA
jgi:hypothetical protein